MSRGPFATVLRHVRTLAGSGPVWDLETGQELLPRDGHLGNASRLTLSPDGKLVAAEDIDALRLWDAGDGRRLASLTGGFASPDGALLAQQADRVIRILDVASRKELARIPAPAEDVGLLVFSPDARMLAGVAGGEVYVWQAPSGRELRRLR